MELEFFLVAESALVDSQTSRMSLFNVIELIEDTPPTVIPLMHSVVVLRVSDEDADTDWQATLRFHAPGTAKEDFHQNFKVRKGASRHRLVQRLEGFPIEKEGDVEIELLLNGKHLASHHIIVRAPQDPA
jgi:hypothetical protein